MKIEIVTADEFFQPRILKAQNNTIGVMEALYRQNNGSLIINWMNEKRMAVPFSYQQSFDIFDFSPSHYRAFLKFSIDGYHVYESIRVKEQYYSNQSLIQCFYDWIFRVYQYYRANNPLLSVHDYWSIGNSLKIG
jgi:hypothetical protein